MFVGPDGLRAVARWLIYLVMAAIVLLIEGAIMHFVHPYVSGTMWWRLSGRGQHDAGRDLARLCHGQD